MISFNPNWNHTVSDGSASVFYSLVVPTVSNWIHEGCLSYFYEGWRRQNYSRNFCGCKLFESLWEHLELRLCDRKWMKDLCLPGLFHFPSSLWAYLLFRWPRTFPWIMEKSSVSIDQCHHFIFWVYQLSGSLLVYYYYSRSSHVCCIWFKRHPRTVR